MADSKDPIHVFVDNSNIFGGAQRVVQTYEPHVPWPAIRVHIANVLDLIEQRRPAETRVLAGSVPPGNEDLWKYAKNKSYNTDLLRRVESDEGRLVEQGVDELLHLKIANVLLDRDRPETLILATGDGKVSQFGTGFALQAERALRRGWDVEIWSWRGQLSRKFAQLSRPVGTELRIYQLDSYYHAITFVKGGSYYDQLGKTIMLAERSVKALPQEPAIPSHTVGA